MKAIVFTEYGPPDVVRLEEVEKPEPAGDQVLVRIFASSVNAGDWHIMRADPFLMRLAFGLRKPKISILGMDIAGRVEAAGPEATRFRPGDEVFGDISRNGYGGFAEYVCVSQEALALKPANVSFEEAAAVPAAGTTALQALRDKGKIQAGQKVLIHGASGGVGSYAVQLARHFGADVTAVCSSGNLDRIQDLGAHRVIDYTREDFLASGEQYDLILAANGTRSIFDYCRALRRGGMYVSSGGSMKHFFQSVLLGPLLTLATSKTMSNFLVRPNGKDVSFLAGLLESGTIEVTIDRRYTLERVPDAIRYIEGGHVRGKVVIVIAGVSDG